MKPRRQMGELEYDIMEYIWAVADPVSPADVQAAVAPELAYTTVTTILSRLVEKGRLARERSGRVFVYSPTRSEAEHRAGAMTSTLGDAADKAAVLSSFVDALSPQDAEVLRALLDKER
jgi:predicted transcriptional regulator